jgi:hypothetical protein
MQSGPIFPRKKGVHNEAQDPPFEEYYILPISYLDPPAFAKVETDSTFNKHHKTTTQYSQWRGIQKEGLVAVFITKKTLKDRYYKEEGPHEGPNMVFSTENTRRADAREIEEMDTLTTIFEDDDMSDDESTPLFDPKPSHVGPGALPRQGVLRDVNGHDPAVGNDTIGLGGRSGIPPLGSFSLTNSGLPIASSNSPYSLPFCPPMSSRFPPTNPITHMGGTALPVAVPPIIKY